MIINSAPKNDAVLSNVGEVGEFRIRNSAKAFAILSSGLYSNKIRAIIREYSCNAVDSHIEAGRADVPFDVHLPTKFEPWFSVRDYGVGLSHDGVVNVFTTYFETTKADSNDVIGGLGLGGKSAFSFTDNFTIVAVKDGKKGVYTAFLNEHGVPSIALMNEESSNEPSGVEIRFAVEDQWDFNKFQSEAQFVYKHFKLRPVISGNSVFEFHNPSYDDVDIIPGVHVTENARKNVAIMGNIEYPILIPSNHDLGELNDLLKCNVLTMEFNIGELDIQASREGLSYIPQTVDAIKRKLELVNDALSHRIASEMGAIQNKWEKAYALTKKLDSPMWHSATKKYILDTGFDLIDPSNRWARTLPFYFTDEVLEKNFNIKVSAFGISSGYNIRTVHNIGNESIYNTLSGSYEKRMKFAICKTSQFVINDTKTGAFSRAKHHWRNLKDTGSAKDKVYVLNKADKSKEMDVDAFFAAISNPPAEQMHNASSLMLQERAVGISRDVAILKLEKRDNRGYQRSGDMVWRDANKLAVLDPTKTYYYVPLSGYQCAGAAKDYDMKTFAQKLVNSGIFTDTIYGVRKADLEEVMKLSNWINLDDHLITKLSQVGAVDVMGIVKKSIDFDSFFKNTDVNLIKADSPYMKFHDEFKNVTNYSPEARNGYEFLCIIYNIDAGNGNDKATEVIDKYTKKMSELSSRYPLINELGRYCYNTTAVAEYVNAIDLLKKA